MVLSRIEVGTLCTYVLPCGARKRISWNQLHNAEYRSILRENSNSFLIAENSRLVSLGLVLKAKTYAYDFSTDVNMNN